MNIKLLKQRIEDKMNEASEDNWIVYYSPKTKIKDYDSFAFYITDDMDNEMDIDNKKPTFLMSPAYLIKQYDHDKNFNHKETKALLSIEYLIMRCYDDKNITISVDIPEELSILSKQKGLNLSKILTKALEDRLL